MNAPDLTPTMFIKRTQTRAAVRRWMLPLGLCAVFALVAIAIEQMQAVDPPGQLAEDRVIQAQSRLEMGRSEIAAMTGVLEQHRRELQAAEHLTLRPDWSGVLTLVARQFDARMMMMGFELGEATASSVRSALGPIASDVPTESVWLVVRGVAEANSDVPGLIMRLEGLGLFQRVVMTGSQRESFAGGSRMAFTLACRVE